MNNYDKQKMMDAIVSSSGGKIDKSTINNAVNRNDVSSLIQNLSAQDREKLMSVINDKASMQSFLSSPEARAVLKSFIKGGGKNG